MEGECKLCGITFRTRKEDVIRIPKDYIPLYTISLDHMWWILRWDVYKDAISRGVCTADGTWIKRLIQLKCGKRVDRLAGSRIIYDFLSLAKENELRVAFVGGTQEVLREASERIKREYGLEVYTMDPGLISYPFHEVTIENVLSFVEDKEPHFVFFALGGAPKQELFMDSLNDGLKDRGVLLSMGIGGTLDMIAGRIKLAPKWVSDIGLEWLWRGMEGFHRLTKIRRGYTALFRVLLRLLRGKC